MITTQEIIWSIPIAVVLVGLGYVCLRKSNDERLGI
jgi:hypothetical protein